MSSLLKMGDQNKSLKRSNGTLYHEIGNEEAEKIPELEFIWYILKWPPSRMQQSIPITVNIRNFPSSMDTIRAVPFIFIKKEKCTSTLYSRENWRGKSAPLSLNFAFLSLSLSQTPWCTLSLPAHLPPLQSVACRPPKRHSWPPLVSV